MAIVKNIVDLMDGTISVASVKGRGTTFTVDLDIAISEQANVAVWDKSAFEGMRVLFVDDELVLESAGEELAAMAMRVDYANSPAAALEYVTRSVSEKNEYQLIIVDWKMPEMSGLELAAQIRNVSASDMPILVSSAYNWVDIEKDTKAAGITGFISKPLFKSTVFSKLTELSLADGGDSAAPECSDASLPLCGVKILLVDDNELNVEVASELLAAAGAETDSTVDGRQALEKFAASADGYYDIILMDVQMPIMNGYEATKEIRSLTERKDALTIPIIAMTANAFDSDVKDAIASGMNAHVAKPVDINALYGTIKKLLGSKA